VDGSGQDYLVRLDPLCCGVLWCYVCQEEEREEEDGVWSNKGRARRSVVVVTRDAA
jgi:hypothetical protein